MKNSPKELFTLFNQHQTSKVKMILAILKFKALLGIFYHNLRKNNNMKKLILIIDLILCSLLLSSSKINDDEVSVFLNNNNLSYEDLKPYLFFNTFKLEDFFILEDLRVNNNYSYLETINYYYHQETKPALFKNTNLVLVNKRFYLDKDYIPLNIVAIPETINQANVNIMISRIVLDAYINMITDLHLKDLYIFSGYRDYQKQKILYDYYNDDNYSAKPGFSEHQTGLALDLSRKDIGLTDLFKTSYEYKVLLANCHKYGFIIRYPEGKTLQTGYAFEPWHFRYVGKIHATYIMENNLTLEEYLYANFEFLSP